MATGRRVCVIGAGAVGTCCALYLQREGFEVTLIDRDGPGNGCSAGNAGNIGFASFIPYAKPGIWKTALGMWRNPEHPLDIRLGHLPRSAPWFLRFLANGTEARFSRIADALADLTRFAFDAYEPLLRAAGNETMIRREGRFFVYETTGAFEAARREQDMRRDRGVEIRALSGAEAREIEPALGPAVKHAYFLPEGGFSLNPQRMIDGLARHFALRGGTIVQDEVTGFEIGPEGPRRVTTADGGHDADDVVIAAGAYSGRLASRLGTKVLLESERGYHFMIADPDFRMRLPVSSERNVAMVPMEHGVRLSTGAEFSGLDGEPRWDLSLRIVEGARKAILPGLKGEIASRWHGHRPATPDGMPVIGRSPVHRNVFFAFGHGHIGLGSGAITGRLIAQVAAGKSTDTDLTPFRADRF